MVAENFEIVRTDVKLTIINQHFLQHFKKAFNLVSLSLEIIIFKSDQPK